MNIEGVYPKSGGTVLFVLKSSFHSEIPQKQGAFWGGGRELTKYEMIRWELLPYSSN